MCLGISVPFRNDDFKRGCSWLSEYEQVYGRDELAVQPSQRLQSLVKRAYKQTGQKVVVLIDEYDAPLLDVVHEKESL